MNIDDKLTKRFWQKVDRRSDQDCWNWTAAVRATYGCIAIDRKPHLAHRVAYQLSKGDIPDGLLVLHTCDNRLCCNPNHLFLGTYTDNNRDKASKGRSNPPYGEREPNHKLTADQVILIRQLYRDGARQVDLAAQFNVSQHLISLIVRRKAWPHLK